MQADKASHYSPRHIWFFRNIATALGALVKHYDIYFNIDLLEEGHTHAVDPKYISIILFNS